MAHRERAFLLYSSYEKQIELLTDAEAGALFKKIFECVNDREPKIQLSPLASMAFSMIEDHLQRDKEKYNEICKKRSDAGKKGNEKRWGGGIANATSCENNIANAKELSQTVANGRKNRQEQEQIQEQIQEQDTNTNTKDTPLKSPQGETPQEKPKQKKLSLADMERMIDGRKFSTAIKSAVTDWAEYKKEKRDPYKEMGFKSFLTIVQNNIEEYDEDAVIKAITFSMGGNYKGVVWDKCKDFKKPYDALEKFLNSDLEEFINADSDKKDRPKQEQTAQLDRVTATIEEKRKIKNEIKNSNIVTDRNEGTAGKKVVNDLKAMFDGADNSPFD